MSDTYNAYREGLESLLRTLEKPTLKQTAAKVAEQVIITAIVLFIFAAAIMLLWNSSLVGSVDGVHPLTFWRALGLMLLVRIFPNNPKIKD